MTESSDASVTERFGDAAGGSDALPTAMGVAGDGVTEIPLSRGDGVTEIPLSRGDGVTAWRQIADDIERDIVEGRLVAGAQLPTEAALAQRFAVNRHTVRRAVAVLASRGLVRTAQGRGTFVEARPIAYPIGQRTRFTEIVTHEGRSAGGEVLEAAVVPAPADIAAALRIGQDVDVLRVRSRRFIDGVPVSIGTSFLPLPRFAGFEAALRSHRAVTPALAACGVADYRRLETRVSARVAGATEAAALDLAAGRVLLMVDSVNVDVDGVPIQATQALFSADRVQLLVES